MGLFYMKLRSFVLLVVSALPGLAVDQVQFALPDRAQYVMTMTLSQESKMAQRKATRSAQITARVDIGKTESGHRLSVTYLTHYETATGMPSAGDLKGLKVVYEIDSIGKITHAEGLEEVVKRLTAAMALPPALVEKAVAAQRKMLSEQCELIATSMFGKPVKPGMQWKELQVAQGMGFKPKPVTRDMKSIGTMACGLGECFAVEGTYQYNSAEEVAKMLEAVFEAEGKEPVLSTEVNSSWDAARFRILIQPETGLVAGYQETVVGSTVIINGKQTSKEERSRRIEFTLRNEHLETRPMKGRIFVP
jgi:hypothetical protein